MKFILHCSSAELNMRLMNLVQKEREMLSEIILHIQEISRRKIFLELGYPSMFSYMTEHLKYSPGSAMRRLDAAKVVSEAPEVLQQLQSGSLNLSQVSMVEQTARQVCKTNPQRSVTATDKRELLKSLSGKTKAESEVLIAQALGKRPANEFNAQTHQADESVMMTITFSKEEWQKIEKMRELLSNATGGGLKETIVHVAGKVIQQKTSLKSNRPVVNKNQIGIAGRDHESATNEQIVTTNNKKSSTAEDRQKLEFESKQISELKQTHVAGKYSPAESLFKWRREPVLASTRKFVLRKFVGCQYKSEHNEKVCGSKTFLNIEHLHPVWAGGSNQFENLTVLCSAHNFLKYRQQAGIRKFVGGV